jgi:hypothetical protein
MCIVEHHPKAHLLVSSQQVLKVTPFPSVLQLPPERSGRPMTKHIPSEKMPQYELDTRSHVANQLEISNVVTKHHPENLARMMSCQKSWLFNLNILAMRC